MPQYIRENGGIRVIPDENRGLDIQDALDPSKKRVIYQAEGKLGGFTYFETQGEFAFGVNENRDAIKVVDISNPLQPELVSTFTNEGFENIYGFDISGNYAYVIDRDTNQFSVVDLSNPKGLSVAGTYNENTSIDSDLTNEEIKDLAHIKDTVYVIAGNFLFEIDVSNPVSPNKSNSTSFGVDTGFEIVTDKSSFSDGRYVTTFITGFGVTPIFKDRQDLNTDLNSVNIEFESFPANDAELHGNYAYVVGYSDDDNSPIFYVIDGTEIISNGNAEGLKQTKILEPEAIPKTLSLHGDFAYAVSDNYITTVNIEDGYGPKIVSETKMLNVTGVTDSDMVGDILFVSDEGENGLSVII